MSSQQYRLSLGSSNILKPFNNVDPNLKSSWLCNLCNGSSVVDEDGPALHKKSKINLSKITKTTKLSQLKSTNYQDRVWDQKVDRKGSQRLSLKNPNQLKFSKSMIQSNLQKPIQKIQSSKIIKSIHPMANSTIDRSTIKSSQCNVYNINTFLKGVGYQSRVTDQPLSQKLIQPERNMQNFKPVHIKSSQNITTADSSLNQRSSTYVYTNPRIQQNLQQKVIVPQILSQNYFSEFIPQYQQVYRKPSIKNSQKFYQNFEKLTENCQNIQNLHDPFLFEDIKLVDSIDKEKISKLKTKKSSSSGKSKGSKFIMNIRKVTSRSQEPQSAKLNQSASQYLFGHLGNKIQIGIKKVESFNSEDQGDDQYSQVLSHGQKSFLMTEINEVSERSRISSASRFRFWEEHQKNPQN